MEVTFGARLKDPKKILAKHPEFKAFAQNFNDMNKEDTFTSVIVNSVEKNDKGFSMGLSLKKLFAKPGKNEIIELENKNLTEAFAQASFAKRMYAILQQRDYLGKL